MSRKQSNIVNRCNGYHDHNSAPGNRKRGDYEQRTQQNVHHDKPKDASAEQKKSPDGIRDVLEKVIDCEAARIGLTVADIFKTLTTAAASLPDMELDTEFMYLSIDEDGICVSIPLPSEDNDAHDVMHSSKEYADPGYDEHADEYGYEYADDDNYDEEEEGLLYDGD